MKKIFAYISLVALFMFGCNTTSQEKTETSVKTEENAEIQKTVTTANQSVGKVMEISTAEFKMLIYDYEKHPEKWMFLGKKPCVIDFYAVWCGPCKIVAPIMEELAVEYAGRVDFYKINVEDNKELASSFQVSSIPLIVFSGLKLDPQPMVGAYKKADYKSLIEKMLAE